MGKNLTGKKDYGVSPEEFVRIWQQAETIDDVCKETGMPRVIAHARASAYRNAGVQLKKLKRVGKRPSLDVNQLNAIAAQYGHLRPTTPQLQGGRDVLKSIVREVLEEVTEKKAGAKAR